MLLLDIENVFNVDKDASRILFDTASYNIYFVQSKEEKIYLLERIRDSNGDEFWLLIFLSKTMLPNLLIINYLYAIDVGVMDYF